MIRDPFTDIELPHRGIDFVADVDDTVYATGAGVVSEVRAHRGFGLSIKITHFPKIRRDAGHDCHENPRSFRAAVNFGQRGFCIFEH